MQLIKFPVGSVNAFPVANSRTGSQLATEFNLRSRETVGTPSEIEYSVGPSYTHSMNDFAVTLESGSSTMLQIAPGRALVNGHYFESLVPINIDLAEENYQAEQEGGVALKGNLSIGLRAIYSTEVTMAGAMLAEDEDDALFYGVQIVILPTYGDAGVKLTTPEDSPVNESLVNCHLRLASFTYTQGSIVNIAQNANKVSMLDASRITNINQLMDDSYVKKSGLIAEKLYSFSGKGSDPATGYDTWCDSTDSLMVWDDNPSMISGTRLGPKDAVFIQASTPQTRGPVTAENIGTTVNQGDVVLRIPHKQPEGVSGKYYPDIVIPFPSADYSSGTPGIINSDYTNKIKSIEEKINTYYRMPGGRMRKFISVLRDISELPPIPLMVAGSSFSFDSYIAQLASLKADLAALQLNVNSLGDTINTQISAKVNSAVTTQLATTTNSINSLSTAQKTISTQISELNASIDDLRTRVQALEEDSGGGGGSPDDPATKGDLQFLQDKIDILNESFQQLSDQYSGLQTSVNNALNDLDAATASAKTEIQGASEGYINSKIELLQQNINQQFSSIKAELLDNIATQIAGIAEQYKVSPNWAAGDYVLVAQDMTRPMAVDGRYPSTAYIVQPGIVSSLGYAGTTGPAQFDNTSESYQLDLDTYLRQVPDGIFAGAQLNELQLSSDLSASEIETYVSSIDYSNYRGSPNKDYFVARYQQVSDNIVTIKSYFYVVTGNLTSLSYDLENPVHITGVIPFAAESDVGGFLNVPTTYRGGGYVYRDDNGHLRLLDYDILSQGVLAYQLGADITFPAGITAEEINETLDEYVNSRVAFPNAAHILSGGSSSVIQVNINLSDEDDAYTININGIDSRFGTAVKFTFTGTAAAGSVINFVDCEKIKIDVSTLAGDPTINLVNCGLFYSASTLNAIDNISGLSLWYEKENSTDPNLSVDGMTVTLLDEVRVVDGDEVWSVSVPNDNHYKWGLRSVSFSTNGTIIGAGLLVTDNTTANVADGVYISVCDFTLPQGIGLTYPESKLTRRIKISGDFVTCYPIDYNNAEGYIVKETNFSALTKVYADYGDDSTAEQGVISFKTTVSSATSVVGMNPTKNIDSWLTGSFHCFQGGLVD